jgi:hypothetical protein
VTTQTYSWSKDTRASDVSLLGLVFTLVVGVVVWLLQGFGVLGSLAEHPHEIGAPEVIGREESW